jgi:hypothetical protein
LTDDEEEEWKDFEGWISTKSEGFE